MLTPGVMSAHYSIEYRTLFTKFHATVVGQIGATEQLIFIQLGVLACYFAEEGNAMYSKPIPQLQQYNYLWDRVWTYGDLVVVFAFVTGVHFNLENMIRGFWNADRKCYALISALPYAQFFIMLFVSSYSRWWKIYPLVFIVACGL